MNLNLFAVVIPAAGSSNRFGGGDKLRVPLRGPTVLQRAVALFANRPDVAQIIIPTSPDRFDPYKEHLAGILPPDRLTLVGGGRERWESVLLGLQAVRADIPFVAIHDAARPLTPQAVIDAAFLGAVAIGGSVPIVPEPATLKRVVDGRITQTVDRRDLYQAQTPQCFNRARILEAFQKLAAQNLLAGVTDDAQVFERAGYPVAGTPGSPLNLKITTADDVRLAEALLDGMET